MTHPTPEKFTKGYSFNFNSVDANRSGNKYCYIMIFSDYIKVWAGPHFMYYDVDDQQQEFISYSCYLDLVRFIDEIL